MFGETTIHHFLCKAGKVWNHPIDSQPFISMVGPQGVPARPQTIGPQILGPTNTQL